MIVRQFLQWVHRAPPGERAEATSALARAYLHSDLSPDDLAAAEGAMIMLLDDPSPLVRRALAEVFASAQKAPRVVCRIRRIWALSSMTRKRRRLKSMRTMLPQGPGHAPVTIGFQASGGSLRNGLG
jgi:hypothetical protein